MFMTGKKKKENPIVFYFDYSLMQCIVGPVIYLIIYLVPVKLVPSKH